MRISVCVPYWDRQDSLDRMFEMYAQLYPDLPIEFSICDDGNPIPARVPPYWFPTEPWAQYVSLVRLPLKDHPLNPCVPINRAVAASSGDVIMLTSPEIEHPDSGILPEMLALLQDQMDYVAARCRYKNGIWLAGPESAADPSQHGREPSPPGGCFHFLTMMFRKLWDLVGGFDEAYRFGQACDDNDWLWRLYANGAHFKVTDGIVIHPPPKRIHWRMPHNRGLFRQKWPEAERRALVERREKEERGRKQFVGGRGGATANQRNSVCGGGESKAGVHRTKNGRGLQPDGLVAISGDAEHQSAGLAEGDHQHGDAARRHEGDRGRAPPLVEWVARVAGSQSQDSARVPQDESRRAALKSTGVSERSTSEVHAQSSERRSSILHPEWALVLGGAKEVWDDVIIWEQIYGKQWDGLVVAANDVGCHWPRDLHHWVSLHPDKFSGWEELRAKYGFSAGYDTWGRKARFAGRCVVPWPGGASGMLAIQVAKEVGAVRVILCGVPMTPTPHFEESTVHDGRDWKAVDGHWRAWEKHKEKLMGWVKSMSGRTMEMLGKPTLEWLLEGKVETDER